MYSVAVQISPGAWCVCVGGGGGGSMAFSCHIIMW